MKKIISPTFDFQDYNVKKEYIDTPSIEHLESQLKELRKLKRKEYHKKYYKLYYQNVTKKKLNKDI